MHLEYIIPALIIGLGGSLHCVGMCGPLMFTALYKEEQQSPVSHWVLYHSGRIGMYGLWGMLFGSIGASVKWFGIQQNISLSIGIGIIVILFIRKIYPSYERKIGEIVLLKKIRNLLIPYISKQTRSASLIGGVLNGLLPCGLVYMALAGATAVQDPIHGALFMMLFGVGTLPLLISVLLIGNNLSFPIKKYINKWYPAIIGLMAIMLIIRGLNIGNFFSPALKPGENAAIHCVEE
ncbi:MAG: sulfite exporter TauE/SafE family protein [bacterium]|jgi:sulfite exporter TauE/SafE